MKAKGEELGTKWATLADSTPGEDGGESIISAEVKLCGGRVHGGYPREEIWEGGGNGCEELTAMQCVKRIADVTSGIEPIRVGIEEGRSGVDKEVKSGGGETNLDGPRGPIRLGAGSIRLIW